MSGAVQSALQIDEEALRISRCVMQAFTLYLNGLEEDDLVAVMIGKMTVNEARGKLQLAPLENPDMDRLIIIDPVGVHVQLRPTVVYKAATEGRTAYADFLRKSSQQYLERREAILDESLADGSITEDLEKLLRTERMLAL